MSTEVVGSGSVEPLPEHAKIGPYRLVQELGEGGMGVVHLALDRSGRAVALKVLRPHVAHDPVARARLAREVETLSRITDPGVAPILDADIDGPRPYLVTRYVPGPSLDEVVRRDGPLATPALRRLGQGLAQSLETIHAAGVIHRDLKPGNVLLLDGEPVLIDFGIAHIADDIRLTSTGLVMGTPGYLSPELIEGGEVTRATDWWAWAATVAFGASGRPPFGSGPMDAVLGRVSRGEADLTGVDPLLAPVLAAALTPRAELRPSVEEILAAMDGYAEGRPTTQVLTQRAGRGATAVLPVGVTLHEPWPASGFAGAATGSAPQVGDADYWRPPAAAASLTPEPPLARATSHTGSPSPDATSPHPGSSPGDGSPSPYAAVAPGEGRPVSTTWHDDVEHPDPRIGRPNRTGVLVALGVLLVAGFAVVPVVAAAVTVAWMLAARTADRSMTSLVLRRHAARVRRSDVPLAVAAGPWHLLVAAVATILSAVVPVLVGISTAFCTALAVSAATGGDVHPATSAPLAVGALLGIWVAWWGPGGAGLRRGSRSVVRSVTGGPGPRQALVAVVLLCAVALALWCYLRGGDPSWWPLRARPAFATSVL